MLSRLDLLIADVEKENKLLKTINNKIDELNKGRGEDKRLQHALNVPAEVCCTNKGIKFEYRHGTISDKPTEILIDYEKLEPFLTEEFKQMLRNNEGYEVYNDAVKPEPVNQAVAHKAVSAPAVKKPAPTNYYKKPVKSKYRSRRHYNGARRRSGYHGYSGRRSWSRRQR